MPRHRRQPDREHRQGRFAESRSWRLPSREDQGVSRVDVPFLGDPLDGREIDVDIDDDGIPPGSLPESALWFAFGSELLETDLDGRYELELVAGG